MAFIQLKTSAILFIAIFYGYFICSTICVDTSVTTTATSSSANERILEFRKTNFSTWNQKVRYNSSIARGPKGMEPLYKISNQMLDLFLGDKPIPDGK